MSKNFKKIVYIALIVATIASMFSCGKKTKHKWVEVGAEQTTEKITPGVHPERGSISDAVPIETVIVYVPLGIQEKEENVQNQNGTSVKVKRFKSAYKTVLYDVNEITPETVDMALKDLRVLGEDSEFYSLEILDDNDSKMAAGPGASNNLTKKGLLSYVDYISSPLDNTDNYEGKGLNEKDLVGRIGQEDIVYCVTETFASNFNLTSCDIQLVGKNGLKLED